MESSDIWPARQVNVPVGIHSERKPIAGGTGFLTGQKCSSRGVTPSPDKTDTALLPYRLQWGSSKPFYLLGNIMRQVHRRDELALQIRELIAWIHRRALLISELRIEPEFARVQIGRSGQAQDMHHLLRIEALPPFAIHAVTHPLRGIVHGKRGPECRPDLLGPTELMDQVGEHIESVFIEWQRRVA